MKWFKSFFRLFKRERVTLYDGCILCYGSGVVRLPSGNRHFRGPDILRLCPDGCELTEYGRGQMHRANANVGRLPENYI